MKTQSISKKKRSGKKEIIVLDGQFQILFFSDLLFLDISCVLIDFLDFLDFGPTVQVSPLDPEEPPASERATHRIPHAAGRQQSVVLKQRALYNIDL